MDTVSCVCILSPLTALFGTIIPTQIQAQIQNNEVVKLSFKLELYLDFLR